MTVSFSRAVIAAAFAVGMSQASAITLDPFPGDGFGGIFNGQAIMVGPVGEVFELDTYIKSGPGPSTSLGGFGPALPPGIVIDFSHALLDGDTDLVLSLKITNGTGAALPGVVLMSYLDGDIDVGPNGADNEIAAGAGALAPGQGFEVDDPGLGDILANLLSGALDGTNPFMGAAGNVAMALSFDLGSLLVGEMAIVDIMISEDGDSLGPFALTQSDPDSPTALMPFITFSGEMRPMMRVDEPGTLVLLSLAVSGLVWARRRRR